ncbi:ABC transporter permease subunit [[Clostridium] polysaccharolyticum]|uniref:Putative aldouronate transport system permease protein n=1 Tax=[Clostridium] polysaccharolyticum TaxID=29364 RepID=A0A1I0CT14_9FIRM|nr:ABC transporter permease subunit [[Clostridium] polysaccharolyticum]SET22505.1 putative aldouronate transport system permease protein [[Clostridium] polysaccharolyticum]
MEQARQKKSMDRLVAAARFAAILLAICLFIPGLNPSRISGLIGKNLSLFTSGLFYKQLIANFGRCLKKGWVLESTLRLLFVSSMIAIVGIILVIAGGCMSLGERKFKKLGAYFTLIGSAITGFSFVGIYVAYKQVSNTQNLKKVAPVLPDGFIILLVLVVMMFLLSVLECIFLPKPDKEDMYEMQPRFQLFLMLLPFVALSFVFSYLPLSGWRFAFFDYKAGDTLTMDKFVGFKWFAYLFRNAATRRDIIHVIRNTLAMSFINIAMLWVPMAFAIFLTEIKSNRFRRFVQIFTTIPNFISWVLVYAVAFAIFSTDGFLSTTLVDAGIMSEGKNFLLGGGHVWLKMFAWGTWKGLGWNAIIYIAAISGIDQQLYEAATVDGAGRFQRMWSITVPSLIPTFCVLLLLAVAGILNNGLEQYLVFENADNSQFIQVLDLYVYKLGIGKGIIPLSTVIGMAKSIISVILLFVANKISKMIRGESIV